MISCESFAWSGGQTLTPAQHEAFTRRLAAARAHRAAAPPLVAGPRIADPPLSFAQQQLWILHQLDPESRAYNVPVARRVRGPLDVEALRRAFEALVTRHEALRTVFRAVDGAPRQHVLPPGAFSLPIEDLTGLAAAERERVAVRRAEDAALVRFDLASGPLLQARLVRLGAHEHVLLFTMHHMVVDGASMTVVWRELGAAYGAFARGAEPALPPLPVQYADYAVWSRGWLTGETLQGQVDYWKESLAEAPADLALPFKGPRPAVATSRGNRVDITLDASSTAALRELARRQGATLFTVLLAALRALLARYTGQTDLCIGTAMSNRSHRELDDLVGFFVNTLVLRGQAHGSDRFVDLLAREKQGALGAYAHRDAPLELIVGALGIERASNRMPLLQVMCADLGEIGIEGELLPGLVLEPFRIELDLAIANFDLAVDTCERAGVREISVGYNEDLFTREAVADLTARYVQLLTAVAARPEQRLSQIELVRPDERAALFERPARDVVWESEQPTVIAQIERWMRDTPDAPAVLWHGKTTRYRELDRDSARLAAILQARGVGPDRPVAVVAERGVVQIASVLAVVRAGGAYVPIKPDLPADRIAWMLVDTAPEVILWEGAPPPAMDAFADRIVRLDRPETWPRAAAYVAPAVPADSLAYIIYTSGSSGRPKGVMVTRRGFDAQMRWIQRELPLRADDRCLQLHAFTFDASVSEIFWPLIVGGALVLPRPGGELEPEQLGALVADTRTTVVHFVPSMMWVLLETLDPARWASVRLLVTGGEALTAELARRCTAAFPHAELINTYGPTETTVNATFDRHRAEAPIAIGRPVANTTAYVLDADLMPVPPGGIGELWIGGVQLARGYLRQPAMTAERFMPSPFAARAGERIYRTGDLVRQQLDGTLEFVGRSDAQVKVRGFRIELGEIEAVLLQHAEIRAAHVVARDHASRGVVLVAYVVGSGAIRTADLQAHVAARLPDYMVPSAFVLLDELPLTASGKIDRKALPAPVEESEREAPAAPRTPTEQALVEIWCEVLGISQVGVDDNFFELGGHSLLAVRAVSRIRKQLAPELPLRSLFATRTVAVLAREIDRLRSEATRVPAVQLEPMPRTGELPLSFAQQRLWFLHQLDPDNRGYNVPAAYRMRGPLDAEALRRSLEHVIERHEALRTVFPAIDGVPHQHIRPPGPLALPIDDLTALAPAERERETVQRMDQMAQVTFDLVAGPLLFVRLLQLSATDHRLLINIHHIVCDGWSFEVLWRELGALYTAFTRGAPASLQPLPLQYADYALWQRRSLSGEILDRQLAYWKQQLAGAPADLALPFKASRPAVPTFRGGRVHLELEPALAAGLRTLAIRSGATVFMVLLAALRALLARYTGQHDLCIGTAVSNRSHTRLDSLIGFFVNTLVLRGQVHDDDRFVDLLAREQRSALAAYANQDAPFERVVDTLGLERSVTRMPLIQVMCVDQGEVGPGGEWLPGVETELVHSDLELAHVDLSFDTLDRAGVREISAVYNADRFHHETIVRMTDQYRRLLEAVAADPERRISAVELIGEAERDRLVNEWNATARPVPAACVHELFAHQAQRTPDAIAVAFGTERLTYRALDRRSNRLARYLRGLGVGPDVLVGICLDRSPDMVVGLLGILKAGGAYLPIDPAYPADRIAFMLASAQVAIVLASEATADRLPSGAFARFVRVDADRDAIARHDAGELPNLAGPRNLAYAIYTSGSTGQPKGVAIEHGGLTNYVAWALDAYALGAGSGAPVHSSLGFDLTVTSLFLPLLAGAAVTLVPGTDVTALAASLTEAGGHRLIKITPAHLDVLARQLAPEVAATASHGYVIGGEALRGEALAWWRARNPAVRLWNEYGPTETVVGCCVYELPIGAAPPPMLPIGTPIANTQLYILDAALALVPTGAAGELYIGGAGVARGYLNRPDLTAERFVPDPFGPPGARLYRTGDLARHSSDGVLEYLGRIDHQVKLRGFRIELGEIEAVLVADGAIHEALAVVREDVPGDRRLVAYVVGDPGRLDASDLRARVAGKLPAYMVPSAIVILDRLPLTPNGKIDRKALPPPTDVALQRATYVAPSTATELALARIWAEVLGVEVGIHDNFFALGGHSLLAVRLVARIGRTLDVELLLRTAFERPTIAEQAELVAGRDRVGHAGDEAADERELAASVAALNDADVAAQLADWSQVQLPAAHEPGRELDARQRLLARLVAQHRIDARASLALAPRIIPTQLTTFSQQMQWDFHERGNFPALGIHATAFALHGPVDARAMQRAIAALIARQAALRTTFAIEAGRLTQRVHDRGTELELVDLSREQPGARAARVRELFAAVSRPHDLRREVFRAQLVHLDDREHVLLLSPHHIVIDGFSWDVIESDLAAFYRAFATGSDPALAPLELRHADFCFWQRTLEQRPVGRRHLAYWAGMVADYQPLELPGDGVASPRAVVGMALDTYPEGTLPFAVEGATWSAIERLCTRLGCTPYTVIATGFLLLLTRWANRTDACLCSASYLRSRPGSEDVVGTFMTTYPLRVAFDPDRALEQAVRRCHDRILANHENADVAPASALPRFVEWTRYNLNYQLAAESDAVDFGDVQLERLDWSVLERRTPHDLALFLVQDASGVRGKLVYNADRFSAALAGRVAARLAALIHAITATPAERISALPREP